MGQIGVVMLVLSGANRSCDVGTETDVVDVGCEPNCK